MAILLFLVSNILKIINLVSNNNYPFSFQANLIGHEASNIKEADSLIYSKLSTYNKKGPLFKLRVEPSSFCEAQDDAVRLVFYARDATVKNAGDEIVRGLLKRSLENYIISYKSSGSSQGEFPGSINRVFL
jgi:hypothetical protein